MAPLTPSPAARLNESESPNKTAPEEQNATAANSKTALMTSPTSLDNSNMMGGMYSNTGFGSPYGGLGMGMGGMGMGGMGMMPYYGGTGPLSGLNQFLFGVQNVIFSLGQAVQIVGMNTQALQQLLESGTTMVDNAIATWHEMQTIDRLQQSRETEEEKKRRRRLRALRWALVMGVSYAAYKIVRYILSISKRKRLTASSYPPPYGARPPMTSYPPDPYQSSNYGPSAYGSPYGGFSPYGNGMY